MFYPMFAMVLLTFIVTLYLVYVRIQAVRRRQLPVSYFRLNSGTADVPVQAATAARHYSNLFEVPLLFYVTCLVAIQMGLQGPTMVTLAWIFVISRIVHTLIHLSYNKVLHRMLAFATGVFCVLIMWVLMAITLV